MAFTRAPKRKKRGILVRLPDGSTKDSLAELARVLGCRPDALRRHIIDHTGGCAVFGSLPDPARCGANSPRYKGETACDHP